MRPIGPIGDEMAAGGQGSSGADLRRRAGFQLDHAVPVLHAAGFKATFFLAGLKVGAASRWRAVGAEGHELANHTIFHPCPQRSFTGGLSWQS